MPRFLYCIFLFLFTVSQVSAQPFIIKGSVTDTLNANRLHYASVTLIRAADSMLEHFTRTSENGEFNLEASQPDQYILIVAFPGFADYVDVINVKKENPVLDVGAIPMVTKTHLLSEFVLKQQIGAIKIKGDTTEYVADSFIVREGASVEELLKKLPGIQVNKNGEVIAQGEKVQKILVDGEEFFTDDPAVVTKNLQAKTVDKVQVFDKKSEQAEFTGIDDGMREKTINLQLKENMKKGYFGKIAVGGGTDEYFENRGMVNAFKGKRKISAFGIIANTGKVGLGWQDREKFGDGGGLVTQMEDGMIYSYYSQDENEDMQSWNGSYSGQGIPSVWTGGLHYSNKWLEDKIHLNGSYRFAKQNIETAGNTLAETNLAEYKQYSLENNSSLRTGERHKAGGIFEWKTDSTSEVKLVVNANYAHTKNTAAYQKEAFMDSLKQYQNSRNTSTDADSKYLNTFLTWKKKFAKPRRTLVAEINERLKNNNGTGFYFSATDYFNPVTGLKDSFAVVDQKKTNQESFFSLNGKINYTEPISKVISLQIAYEALISNNSSEKLSFDKSAFEDAYNVLSDSTSSRYDFNYFVNQGNASLNFDYNEIKFSLGGLISSTDFTQRDNLLDGTDYSYQRSYINYAPKAGFTYRPKGQQKSLRINYSGSTRQPSMEQIQPLRENTDPTNIAVGNPELKQEFNHMIYANYNSYKVLTGSYTYVNGGMNLTQDDISRSEIIDLSGNRQYQFVNVNGNYNGWFYGGFGFKLQKIDLQIGVHTNASISRINNFVNGQKNTSLNNAFGMGLTLNKDKEKKYYLNLRPSVNYNQNTSTINELSTNFWSYELSFEGNITLPLKLEIGMEVNGYLREKIVSFDRNNDALIWNAYLSKKFLKESNLELRASVFDILNQNIGFNRFASSNVITQQNYNTVARYGMLSLIWNFTKTTAGKPADDNSLNLVLPE